MTLKGVQFFLDQDGKKTAVLIDLRRCGPVWEDFHDVLMVEARKDELRISWDDVKKQLQARRARRG